MPRRSRPALRIATYNVNGVNGRLPVLLRWLAETAPDIVCLQELKAPQEKFPQAAIRAAGYEAIWLGQKSWNGVAILSRGAESMSRGQAFLAILTRATPATSRRRSAACSSAACTSRTAIRRRARNSIKLRWFDAFAAHASSLLASGAPVVLAGDYNVMPTELDVYKPERWLDDALFRSEVREAFRALAAQGWTDALRSLNPDTRIYTFWDYFRNAFGRDAGLRIDHLLLSPALAPRLRGAGVDREVRGWDKTSDHAPVWIDIAAT